MIQVLKNADLMEKRGHWQIYQSRQSCSSSRISGKIGAFKKIEHDYGEISNQRPISICASITGERHFKH